MHLTYVKFYERALVDAQDITRVECVCSLAKKYYKTIPMAVISNDKTEDVIQLLTHVGILHLFDVVIGHEGELQGRCSQEDMFANAANRLNQRIDTCLGKLGWNMLRVISLNGLRYHDAYVFMSL